MLHSQPQCQNLPVEIALHLVQTSQNHVNENLAKNSLKRHSTTRSALRKTHFLNNCWAVLTQWPQHSLRAWHVAIEPQVSSLHVKCACFLSNDLYIHYREENNGSLKTGLELKAWWTHANLILPYSPNRGLHVKQYEHVEVFHQCLEP